MASQRVKAVEQELTRTVELMHLVLHSVTTLARTFSVSDGDAAALDAAAVQMQNERGAESCRMRCLRHRLQQQMLTLKESIEALGDVDVDAVESDIAVLNSENLTLGLDIIAAYDEAVRLYSAIESGVMELPIQSL